MILRLLLVMLALTKSQMILAKESIYLNGFMTISAAKTSVAEKYLGDIDDSARVDGHDTKFGLNIFGQVNDQWSVVSQITAKASDGYELSTDWMFINYAHDENLFIKVGRQKFPIFLKSDFLDVGRAYPWVRPPAEVYDFFPFKSMSGINAMYRFEEVMEEWTADVEAYFGGIRERYESDVLDTLEIVSDHLSGGAITIFDEDEHFRMRLAYINSVLSLPQYTVASFGPEIYSAGFEYNTRGFLLMTEYGHTKESRNLKEAEEKSAEASNEYQEALARGDFASAQRAQTGVLLNRGNLVGGEAGYVTFGYHFKKLLPTYTYSFVKESDDKPFFVNNQKSHTLGIRYSFNPKTDFKVDVAQIEIPDEQGQTGLYQQGFSNVDTARIEPKTHLISAAFNVNF